MVARAVSKAAMVGEDGRRWDEEETMTVKGAPVKSLDADILLCSFEEANREDFDVVPTKKNTCRLICMKLLEANFKVLWFE